MCPVSGAFWYSFVMVLMASNLCAPSFASTALAEMFQDPPYKNTPLTYTHPKRKMLTIAQPASKTNKLKSAHWPHPYLSVSSNDESNDGKQILREEQNIRARREPRG